MTKAKEAVAIQEGAKTKRPRIKKSDGPNSTASKKTDGPNSTPSENNLVGQEVHGTVDGSFDCGYLLTVKVGALPLILRGLVFEPTLAVPLSNDNDVAPNVKPQVRDDKVSIPMPVQPVLAVNELAQPVSDVNVNGLPQPLSNVNMMQSNDQNITLNVNTNELAQDSNVHTSHSNDHNLAHITSHTSGLAQSVPDVNTLAPPVSHVNALAQPVSHVNELTQPASHVKSLAPPISDVNSSAKPVCDVNGFPPVSNVQSIASNVNPEGSDVLMNGNAVSYNSNAPSGNGNEQLNVVSAVQNNIISSGNANIHINPANGNYIQTVNMDFTSNADSHNLQSMNAATNDAEQSNQHNVNSDRDFAEESNHHNMEFATIGVEQSNQQSSCLTTNFADQSNQHNMNYATNVVEQSSRKNVNFASNFVEQSNQQSMDVATEFVEQSNNRSIEVPTEFVGQPNQHNINYASNVVEQSSQQNMNGIISCGEQSNQQSMNVATNFADHPDHQNTIAADQPSQQNKDDVTNFAYQSDQQHVNATIDFADQSNQENKDDITNVAEQSDRQNFQVAQVMYHTLSSNATDTTCQEQSVAEQTNVSGGQSSFLPGNADPSLDNTSLSGRHGEFMDVKQDTLNGNAGDPSLDNGSVSARHGVFFDVKQGTLSGNAGDLSLDNGSLSATDGVFMDVKQGTLNVVDEGHGAEDLMGLQHIVVDINHGQASGHNGRHVRDGMMSLQQASSVEDLIVSSQDQVATKITNIVNGTERNLDHDTNPCHDTETNNGNLDHLLSNECPNREEMETGIPNTAFDNGHVEGSAVMSNDVANTNGACFLDVQAAELMDYELENGENMVANAPQPTGDIYVSDTTAHLHTETG